MKKALIIALITLVAWMTLIACKSPPTEEMNRAIDAVTRADNDPDTVRYASNTLARARDTLVRMQAESDAKRYDQARNLAEEAVSLAERAIAEGRTGAIRSKDEAANMVSLVGSEIIQTEEELESAKRNGSLDLDMEILEQDLNYAKNSYDQAKMDIEEENYSEAITKVQPVRPVLANIRRNISDAAVETGRAK